jgi:CubicO group peptidase (beta-lactamase class C family)
VSELDLAGLLREQASKHSVPGAAIGILRDGVRTTAYHGLADTCTGEPVTSETRFPLGSLTKPMVATVLARLAEAGHLSLEDSAATHIPELRGAPWAERASVRDLLANCSRLPLRAEVEFSFSAFADDDEALSRLSAKAAPGKATPALWSYTNAGWCLLGRLIETLTGRAWEEAMQVNLFSPAGMDDTTFATKPGAEPRASGHEITAEGPVPVEPSISRAYGPAGTSVLSTVSDLLRFAELHLEDPSLVPLRASHAELRLHAWLDAWCLGWARFDWHGGPVWGWDGLIAGQRSILRLMPEHRGAVVLMANSDTGRALYRSLFGQLLKPVFGISMPSLRLEPSPSAADDLSRFGGIYAWPDQRWEVTPTGAGLVIDGPRGTFEALPIDDCTFLVDATDPDNPTMTFGAFDTGGRPGVLYQMLWGFPARSAERESPEQ